ncbi:MAG: NDP-sugar synthase [Actinomycetota bacterium]|nr:NDP-sugar synthase [Actinomycetota bacterium]
MRAVVLVGGEGTRLRPLTCAVPKQMLPVAEVPMIERVLAYLAAHGVTEAVLSLGYRHDDFLSALPSARALGLRIVVAVEPEPRGTAGAIRFAADAAGIAEPFLALNGDILTDLDLGALMAFHSDHGAEGTLALSSVADPTSFGLVATEGGRVTVFIEKPPPDRSGPGLVNMGAYVLEPSVLDRIPEAGAVSIERDVFPRMVADGSLFAMASTAYWADTGTPERFLAVQLDLLAGRRPGPPAPGAVDRGDGVWTMGTAVIDGQVRPPALVGTAAFIHGGATVESSVIGAGARVNEGATVRKSVLLPGAVVRADAVVDGCLVGEQAVIGEKAWLSDMAVVGPGVEVDPGARLQGVRVPAIT